MDRASIQMGHVPLLVSQLPANYLKSQPASKLSYTVLNSHGAAMTDAIDTLQAASECTISQMESGT